MKARHHILFFVWALVIWQLGQPVIVRGTEADKAKQNPMVTFQEALYQEQTEGDLDKAIELYQKVLDEAAEVERLGARAMYQLGMCHLKKGDTEQAASYFRKLINTYPKQTSTIKKAKKQLDKIAPQSIGISATLPADILEHIISKHFATGKRASQLGVPNNTQVYGVENLIVRSGGLIDVFNMGTDTWTDKRFISRFTPDNKDLKLYNELYQEQVFEWRDVDMAQGKRIEMYWTPDRPVKPGEFRVLGYVYNKKVNLTKVGNNFELKMQNYYGTEVLENFFLILPTSLKIVEHSQDISSHQRLGLLDIYQFERHMHGENNVITVTLDFVDLTMPNSPSVLETSPAIFSDNVSPDTTEITVTFDKEMFPHGYAWCQSMEPFPELAGSPYFSNGNFTSNLPVKLKPGQYYRIGINSPPYQSFRGIDEAPAHQYLLVFATADENGKPTRIPPSLIKEAELINNRESDTNTTIFFDSFDQGDTTPTNWQTVADVPGVKYLWDRKHGSDGSSSLCMKKTVEKYFPIAQWIRSFEYDGNSQQLSVSAQVLAKKAYKATIDALFLDDKGQWIKHEWVSYIGAKENGDPPANHNWTEYKGTVDIPENTKSIVIGLQMYGPGTVWFDELKVAYAGGVQLDARQLVEDFFKHNYRDITSRKTLEWGTPQIDDDGNISIRYKYEATIWDKEKKLYDHVFTFDKNGKYISVTDAEPDPLQAEDLAAEGWKLFLKGKHDEAESKFQQAVRTDPENDNAWQGLGWAQFNLKKYKNAEVTFKRCIRLNPKNAAALNGLGWIAYTDNDKPGAVQWWEKAIKSEPGATAALNGLTKTCMELEEYGKAVKYYQMWLKVDPSNQDAKDGLQKAKSMM